MTELSQQACRPIASSESSLDAQSIADFIKKLDNSWQYNKDLNNISRKYSFNNYYETMAFVNAVVFIIHQQDHHPEFLIGYNYCLISFATHSINGLSINDFICASKINDIK